MATRIYFPSTGAASITPAYDAGWESTGFAASRLQAVTTKIDSAMATTTIDDTSNADQDVLIRSWILEEGLRAEPIVAQVVKIQFRCLEGAFATLKLAWLIKVVSPDGLTIRGTLVASGGAPKRDGTNMATSLTNRGDSTTCAEVIPEAGDFLVFEIGAGGTSAGSGHDPALRYGDVAASDLPEDDTTTTDDNPWIEFANDILFGTPPPRLLTTSRIAVQRAATR